MSNYPTERQARMAELRNELHRHENAGLAAEGDLLGLLATLQLPTNRQVLTSGPEGERIATNLYAAVVDRIAAKWGLAPGTTAGCGAAGPGQSSREGTAAGGDPVPGPRPGWVAEQLAAAERHPAGTVEVHDGVDTRIVVPCEQVTLARHLNATLKESSSLVDVLGNVAAAVRPLAPEFADELERIAGR